VIGDTPDLRVRGSLRRQRVAAGPGRDLVRRPAWALGTRPRIRRTSSC